MRSEFKTYIRDDGTTNMSEEDRKALARYLRMMPAGTYYWTLSNKPRFKELTGKQLRTFNADMGLLEKLFDSWMTQEQLKVVTKKWFWEVFKKESIDKLTGKAIVSLRSITDLSCEQASAFIDGYRAKWETLIFYGDVELGSRALCESMEWLKGIKIKWYTKDNLGEEK